MQKKQCTVKETVKISGIEITSGNSSELIIFPAKVNKGIVFRTPNGECIEANLNNAISSPWPLAQTLLLQGETGQIALPEHLLAQLSAYGIDNAIIDIRKQHSLTSRLFQKFGHARDTYFVPNTGQRVCEALEGNILEQPAERKITTLEEEIITDKLKIEPIDGDEVIINVTTEYKLARGKTIKQTKELTVSPESIKGISLSRSYCRVPFWAPEFLSAALSKFWFPSYGLGSGCNKTNQFYHTRTEDKWTAQQLMEKEVACHTIMDRLGEFSLIPGKLSGVKITCWPNLSGRKPKLRGPGHEYVLNVLKGHKEKFYTSN